MQDKTQGSFCMVSNQKQLTVTQNVNRDVNDLNHFEMGFKDAKRVRRNLAFYYELKSKQL